MHVHTHTRVGFRLKAAMLYMSDLIYCLHFNNLISHLYTTLLRTRLAFHTILLKIPLKFPLALLVNEEEFGFKNMSIVWVEYW